MLCQDGLSPAFYLANRYLLLDPPAAGPAKGSLATAIASILELLTLLGRAVEVSKSLWRAARPSF